MTTDREGLGHERGAHRTQDFLPPTPETGIFLICMENDYYGPDLITENQCCVLLHNVEL